MVLGNQAQQSFLLCLLRLMLVQQDDPQKHKNRRQHDLPFYLYFNLPRLPIAKRETNHALPLLVQITRAMVPRYSVMEMCIINRHPGKSVLARALKTHHFHSTYVGIVQKTSRRPTSTILPTFSQNHQNHGTIVPPIQMQTMESMLVIPLFQPRDHLTDALFRLDPAAFRQKLSISYTFTNITLHYACALASPCHQPTMVAAMATSDKASGCAARNSF